jgi:hypothetical protein
MRQMSLIAANITSSEYMMYGTDFFLKDDTQLSAILLYFMELKVPSIHSKQQFKMSKFTKYQTRT